MPAGSATWRLSLSEIGDIEMKAGDRTKARALFGESVSVARAAGGAQSQESCLAMGPGDRPSST